MIAVIQICISSWVEYVTYQCHAVQEITPIQILAAVLVAHFHEVKAGQSEILYYST